MHYINKNKLWIVTFNWFNIKNETKYPYCSQLKWKSLFPHYQTRLSDFLLVIKKVKNRENKDNTWNDPRLKTLSNLYWYLLEMNSYSINSNIDEENKVPISIGSCLSICVICFLILVVVAICILILLAWLM